MNRHFDSKKALTPPPAQSQSHLSPAIRSQLESHKARPDQLVTERVALSSLRDQSLVEYTTMSFEEECESALLPPFHAFDYLISEENIDYILPSDDAELYGLFQSDRFLNHWDRSFLGDAFWDFVAAMDSDSESRDEVDSLKRRFSGYKAARARGEVIFDEKKVAVSSPSRSRSKFYDFNGLSSDLSYFERGTKSIGDDGRFWMSSNDCIESKSCDVYPINRVLSTSKEIPCRSILDSILPPIAECVVQRGSECEAIIDSGYYRVILKGEWKGQPVAVKMMKTTSIKKERDLLRHIRESILLGRLYDAEHEVLSQSEDGIDIESHSTSSFEQSLNGVSRRRAIGHQFVEELGHCVTPLWISVSFLYKMALDKWILSGFAEEAKLEKLIFMSLQIASSVDLLHSIKGGPFHHTDIQPRQFLLDDHDRVFINDFNRGKFQPFYFAEHHIERCWYCGHRSRGHWRAPEEPVKRPLNEKLDIFSLGLTIWALYSNQVPFKDATFDDLPFIYYEQRRIPPMTPNMPPAIKQLIRSTLRFEPKQRPTANQVVRELERIYLDDLEMVTEGFHTVTSKQLTQHNTWTETNYPPKEPRNKLPADNKLQRERRGR